MKLGFAFYGITQGIDKKTGYSRDFRHCWNNIQTMLIQPFIDQGHEAINYASTYPFEDKQVEEEFFDMVKPRVTVFSDFSKSDAFTAKSKLHDAIQGEELDAVVFTRFDIHFSKKIAQEKSIDFNKINFLFPEDPIWWKSHLFVCDCFYIWNHSFSEVMKNSMRETYGWPRGTAYPDTHGIINFLIKNTDKENLNFISTTNEISNVNTFYTLCRPNVPDHPCFHPEVRAKFEPYKG